MSEYYYIEELVINSNKLIKSATSDIILNIGTWGLIVHSTSLFETKSKTNEMLKLFLQLSGIYITATTAYKYYNH